MKYIKKFLIQEEAGSNIVECTVSFKVLTPSILSTPTFQQMFDRIPEIKNKTAVIGKEYTFKTNNSHMGFIKRLATAMNNRFDKLEFKVV